MQSWADYSSCMRGVYEAASARWSHASGAMQVWEACLYRELHACIQIPVTLKHLQP